MRPWSAAWAEAAQIFWSAERPADHFRTSVSDALADRMVAEAVDLDIRLGRPEIFTVVDIGAGDGDLLCRIRSGVPRDLAKRLRLLGVDLRADHRDGIDWIVGIAPGADVARDIGSVTGLVMAHEWLDEIACDVVERAPDGVDRLVLISDDGDEQLGPALSDSDGCAQYGVDGPESRRWLERWWPLADPGDRAEIGSARDAAWVWLTGLVERGAVVATDYGHTADDRHRRHRFGSLVAYRHGQLVAPTPDGTVNLTAHVAVDSCAARVPRSTVHSQREMLHGVTQPLPETVFGADYARALARQSEIARLRDPRGAGAFAWLRWEFMS